MLSFNLYKNNYNKETPIIFLDIDGVLNTGYDSMKELDAKQESLYLIKKLINDFNAKVVMITYRVAFVGINKIIDIMTSVGIYKYVIDYIPYKELGNYEENKNKYIANYIKDNNIEKYVVIDDYDLFKELPDVFKHFVKVNPDIAFSQDDYNKAKKILS